MNKREDVLKETLQKTEEEVQRWQMFLKENETAIENMTTFSKQLHVDVMVPIGKKALMPGHLLHTNEVMVGHYQGYFSKCTTFKAKEICEFRIKIAKDHLKKFDLEAELWQNKLEKPYAEGVFASGMAREIEEEFDEASEKLWRHQHRIRLKQAKQKEREEREKTDSQSFQNNNDEIFKMLEQAEIMEEFEQELDSLEVDEVNDEMLRKLMSGEMKLPTEKSRLAHNKYEHKESSNNANSLLPNIVKIKDLDSVGTHLRTNNNVQPNREIIDKSDGQNESDEIEMEEQMLPEEVTVIKRQAEYLSLQDRIGFYVYNMEIIRQKLQHLPLREPHELNEKVHLLTVWDYLEELLEEAEESLGETELAAKDMDEEIEEKYSDSEEIFYRVNNAENKSAEKRRISFAVADETLEFKSHEAVTQMILPRIEKSERDIIKLDDFEEQKTEYNSSKVNKFANKHVQIQDKVEQNLRFVSENQSMQDFDMVEKILQSSQCETKTLYIKFQHSPNESYITKLISGTIGSPADIYNIHRNQQLSLDNDSSTVFIDSYEGEDQVNVPVLKEADRQSAFIDPKTEFSNPLPAKSILKNKSAADKENYHKRTRESKPAANKQPKQPSNKEDDSLSTYNKVMREVVEKSLTEPEPLPDVKFIDAHTPKKRISRFKQVRQGNGNT